MLYKLLDSDGNTVTLHTGQSLFTTHMVVMRVWRSIDALDIGKKLAYAKHYGVQLDDQITLRGIVPNCWPQELPEGWKIIKADDADKSGYTFLLNKCMHHISHDDELLNAVRTFLWNDSINKTGDTK